jgi:hypothetical protein
MAAVFQPAALETEKSLRHLLALEKERRGFPSSALVFVGLHNVAQFWWCGMYAVLKSKANEHEFFAAYLTDRLRYAQALGHLTGVPTDKKELLKVGESLTRRDVEALFTSAIKGGAVRKRHGNEPPKYASYRWSFQWKGFVLVGVPDGITPKFVYEFKEAKNRFWFTTASRPVATTQADLYGLFFERPEKRVEIAIHDEGTIEKFSGPVDPARAKDTLARFDSVVSGQLPARPKPFKCANCEYRRECPIGPP